MRWLDLKRKVQEFEEDYAFYRRKLEESSASTALMEREQTSNVSIIQQAMDPVQPAGMRKTLLLAIGLVVSLCAALVFVSIAEFFDHRIYRREDLERVLNVSVMGVVPALKGEKDIPKLLSGGIAPKLLGMGHHA